MHGLEWVVTRTNSRENDRVLAKHRRKDGQKILDSAGESQPPSKRVYYYVNRLVYRSQPPTKETITLQNRNKMYSRTLPSCTRDQSPH